MAWVASRTLSKVKSRAMSPRQPLVPNLIMSVMRELVWRSLSDFTRRASRLPVKRSFFECVNVAHQQHRQEGKHRAEDQARAFLEHRLINHGPGIEEDHFDIEQNEQHRDQIELYRKSRAALADRQHSAFVGGVFD